MIIFLFIVPLIIIIGVFIIYLIVWFIKEIDYVHDFKIRKRESKKMKEENELLIILIVLIASIVVLVLILY